MCWGRVEPRWPSLIAVVERAEREVVVELGVPGVSDGVSLAEGGGGRFMRVGVGLDMFVGVLQKMVVGVGDGGGGGGGCGGGL